MRALAILLVFLGATACGGKQAAPGSPATSEVFPAARWVPAKPTYVISARTMRDAQRAFGDVLDMSGIPAAGVVSNVKHELVQMLGVDLLSADAVAGIGVDLEGSAVMFSEALSPTIVVGLDSPEAMTAFLDRQRERGLRTQSVVVDGVEVFTANVGPDVYLSWAIEGSWLWVHFAVGTSGGTEWFEHSRKPAGSGWTSGWSWAQGLAAQAPAVVGMFDLPGMLAQVVSAAPAAAACARTLDAIERVGLAMETDGTRVAGRLAFDLGDAASRIASNVLALPPGWATASANAPIALQWNYDLRAGAEWIGTCLGTGNDPSGGPLLAQLDSYGVRSVRAFVHSLDPDAKAGTGAVALDLSHARFFRSLLDQIPARSTFESSRTFGTYKGKHVSVPFVGKGDYVLEDTLAIAAMGDGLLAAIGTGTPAAAPPVMAIDLRPPGLSADVWRWLVEQIGAAWPTRFPDRLQRWNDLHLGVRLDGPRLVVELAGTRR